VGRLSEKSILGLALVLCVLGAVAPARADIPVTLVGQWGGPCNAVALSGNCVYLGVGLRLLVLDVSGPASPTVLGMSEVLPRIVQGVAVSGNYA